VHAESHHSWCPSRAHPLIETNSSAARSTFEERGCRICESHLFLSWLCCFDICSAPGKVAAQDTSNCLYNDEHFHIQDFKAEGPRVPEILKMMDNHVCRTTRMSLAVTLAHDPLIDRDFAPVYYTQTDGQVMYYNAIQDVLVAHKFRALPEQDSARVDPLMNASNLIALRETGNGRAISVSVADLTAIVPRMARRVGSATAEKTRSSSA
jgi:hypothetical protein